MLVDRPFYPHSYCQFLGVLQHFPSPIKKRRALPSFFADSIKQNFVQPDVNSAVRSTKENGADDAWRQQQQPIEGQLQTQYEGGSVVYTLVLRPVSPLGLRLTLTSRRMEPSAMLPSDTPRYRRT